MTEVNKFYHYYNTFAQIKKNKKIEIGTYNTNLLSYVLFVPFILEGNNTCNKSF